MEVAKLSIRLIHLPHFRREFCLIASSQPISPNDGLLSFSTSKMEASRRFPVDPQLDGDQVSWRENGEDRFDLYTSRLPFQEPFLCDRDRRFSVSSIARNGFRSSKEIKRSRLKSLPLTSIFVNLSLDNVV